MKSWWIKSLIMIPLLFIFTSCKPLEESQNQTSTSPYLYNYQQQKNELKSYPKLFRAVYEKQQMNELKTYVIPGLAQTKTLNSSGEVSISTDMDPQGLVVSKDYLFISAYSHDRQHFSVIYMLDRKTGSYIKTLILPGLPHAGGIAYDSKTDNLWLTSQVDKGVSQISAISLKTIEDYDFEKQKQPINYDQTVRFEDFSVASYLTYYDENLYVGTFKLNKEGKLSIYPIDEQGKLKDIRKDNTILVENDEYFTMPSETQGITFGQNTFLISTSFGESDSEILLYRNKNKSTPALTDDEYIGAVKMPPYLEQIFAVDDNVYILFESASRYYDHTSAPRIDRVLVADTKTLLD